MPPNNAQPADYLPDNWRQARQQVQGPGATLVTQDLAQVHVHARADAPLAQQQCPFPILIMQPELGPIATDYTTLAEDLASYGFVVVASTPTYSANVLVRAQWKMMRSVDW